MSLHFWKRCGVGNWMEDPAIYYMVDSLKIGWALTLLKFYLNPSKRHCVLVHWDPIQSKSCVNLASAFLTSSTFTACCSTKNKNFDFPLFIFFPQSCLDIAVWDQRWCSGRGRLSSTQTHAQLWYKPGWSSDFWKKQHRYWCIKTASKSK